MILQVILARTSYSQISRTRAAQQHISPSSIFSYPWLSMTIYYPPSYFEASLWRFNLGLSATSAATRARARTHQTPRANIMAWNDQPFCRAHGALSHKTCHLQTPRQTRWSKPWVHIPRILGSKKYMFKNTTKLCLELSPLLARMIRYSKLGLAIVPCETVGWSCHQLSGQVHQDSVCRRQVHSHWYSIIPYWPCIAGYKPSKCHFSVLPSPKCNVAPLSYCISSLIY